MMMIAALTTRARPYMPLETSRAHVADVQRQREKSEWRMPRTEAVRQRQRRSWMEELKAGVEEGGGVVGCFFV